MLSILFNLDWGDQRLVISTLAQGGAASQQRLIPLLEAGSDDVSFDILQALKGNLNVPAESLIGPLIDMVLRGYGFPEQIAEILVECGPEVTEPMLVLLGHESLEIQQFAINVLEKVGDETCTQSLVDCLEHSDQDIRRDAILGLSRLKHKLLIPILVDLLHEEDWCWIAASGLERMGDVSAIPILVDALSGADDLGTVCILEALGKLGNAEVIQIIMPYLEHEDGDIQCVAANALTFLGHPEALKFLMERIEKGSYDYGESVGSGLRFLGKEAVPALIEYLTRKPNHYAALHLLGELEDNRTVPLLERLLWYDGADLDDSDPWFAVMGGTALARKMIQETVQQCAATSLGKIKDKSSVPALIRKLSELSDAREYSCVIRALEEIGDSQAVEPILSKFLEKPEDVNEEMLSALGFFGRHFGAGLLSLLNASKEFVRFVGVLAVTRAGLTEAVGKLRGLEESETESERVRFAAQLALRSISSTLHGEQTVG